MPAGDGTPADDYPLLVQHAVSRYVGGQLLFSLIMGASARPSRCTSSGCVGHLPRRRAYAVAFGVFYGLMEFIPYIGPIIGPLPAVLVALFTNPITALWVVAPVRRPAAARGPRGRAAGLRHHAADQPDPGHLRAAARVQLYGIVGALVALPMIAVIRETVVYLRRHLVLEPWGTRGVGLGLMSDGPTDVRTAARRAADGDSYCRACGASLEPSVRSSR